MGVCERDFPDHQLNQCGNAVSDLVSGPLPGRSVHGRGPFNPVFIPDGTALGWLPLLDPSRVKTMGAGPLQQVGLCVAKSGVALTPEC